MSVATAHSVCFFSSFHDHQQQKQEHVVLLAVVVD
jgi:hypothetical protein